MFFPVLVAPSLASPALPLLAFARKQGDGQEAEGGALQKIGAKKGKSMAKKSKKIEKNQK
jgi:hypothetical protein